MPRKRVVLAVAGCVAASFLLFLPRYLCHAGHADFTPFFPDEHPHGAYAWNLRSGWEYLKALGLRRANMDMFRLSAEWLLAVVAVLATARTRAGRWIRHGVVVAYGTLFLFLVYHYGLLYFYNRTPVLYDDARLALNLGHFLGDILNLKWALVLLALLGAWVAVVTLAALALREVARLASDPLPRAGWIGIGLLSLYCLLSLSWFGVQRDDPLVQLPSKRIVHNIVRTIERQREVAAFQSASPDRSYDPLLEAELDTRPNVYLLVVEAYGSVLATDAEFARRYQQMMETVESRLASKGLHARSRYSAAPVYGGGSWMSLATLQTGVLVGNQQMYDQLTRVSKHYPHLTRFFSTHDYTTVAIQPGNTHRPGLRSVDPFQRDRMIEAPDLDYRGRPFGWGKIPDQYSLGRARETVASTGSPTFFFFMGVTTHAPWDEVPPITDDWRALGDRALEPADDRGYFSTIAYEWEILERFIVDTADDDAIYLVVGDHQPALRRHDRAATYDTPVHVISRDRDLVESFGKYGFETGLWVPHTGDTTDFRHEGLYSLLISTLLERHGTADARTLAFVRLKGADASALNR